MVQSVTGAKAIIISDNLNKLSYIAFLLLTISCIFDPADKIMHMKIPLFIACWTVMILEVFITKKLIILPFDMLMYLFLLLSIPFLSIIYYTLFIGNTPYDGIQYLKSFLFVTIIIVMFVSHNDIIKTLCIVLTALSCSIIIIFIATYNNPELFTFLHFLGQDYGFLNIFIVNYGPIVMPRIFYTTSPMIAIAIAYFVDKAITEAGNRKWFIVISIVNIIALLLSGTRTNILISILLPFVIIYIKVKYKKLLFISFFIIGVVVSTFGSEILQAMSDPTERSNVIKIAHMKDYRKLFEDPTTLLLGQGLGSYYYWSGFGEAISNTELTFLEIFRNYGLILGTLLLMLILYPLKYIKLKSDDIHTCILIGYGTYLLMCSSNPLLFSSSGMIILSAVISSLFLGKNQKEEMNHIKNKKPEIRSVHG